MRDNYYKAFDVEPYQIDWERAAIRQDNSIVKDMILSMLRQALSDWKNIGTGKLYRDKGQWTTQYRSELCEFFNGSWFNDILSVMYPGYSQEAACKELSKQQYNVKELFDPNNNPIGIRRKKKKP